MPKRKILFSPPDISEEEIEEVGRVLRSGWITTGPKVKELEKAAGRFSSGEKDCLLVLRHICRGVNFFVFFRLVREMR